jgi:hypothetical protein
MSGKVLGDYSLSPDVEDEINHHSGGNRYMVLTAAGQVPVGPYGDAQFMNWHANNAADWAMTMGKEAIIVDLEQVLRLPWDRLPVIRDTMDEDENES